MKIQIYKSTPRYSFCKKASEQLPTKLYSIFNVLENQFVSIQNIAMKTNFFFVRFTAVEKKFTFNILSFFCFAYIIDKNKKNSISVKKVNFFSMTNS